MNHLREFSMDDILRDGTRVKIRAIRPDDKDRLLQAFRLLEKESVYTRFFSARNDVSDAELHRAVNVDFDRHVAIVVSIDSGGEEIIIASGRYVRTTEQSAEVAFVVEEDYQGRGIASRLLRHLATIAKRRGIVCFEATVLAQNAPMLAVFKRCGFAMKQTREGSEIHLSLSLPSDDAISRKE